MRILYFGDGPWGTRSLQRLIDERCEILGVVVRKRPTDPDLLDLTRRLQLPLFQPDKVNAPAFLDIVRGLRPDLNLSVSYDQILRRDIIASAPQGFVNFHAGLLPCYRGRNVINWAIINGESSIGLTAHYVDEGIDTGDIILQRRLPIAWTDTYADVLQTILNAFPDVVAETCRLVASGQVQRQAQSHRMGTYFAARRDGDEWLDWSASSRDIYNKIRAITRPGPGARTMLQGQPLTVWRARYDATWPRYVATPGEVVGRKDGEGIWVKTGDSVILVQETQRPGESPMLPTWPIGTRLGVNLADEVRRLQDQVSELQIQMGRLLASRAA